MGKTHGVANNFTHVRGLQGGQMHAKLSSSQISVGLRYSF